jgi:ABC-type polar amino acid transport system ATPase subunit
MTMIVVTHEMQFALDAASRVIFLDNGRIVEDAATEEFFERPKTERSRQFLERFRR